MQTPEETKTTFLSAAPIFVLAAMAAAIYLATVSLSGSKPQSLGETSVGGNINELPIPPGVVRSSSRCTGKTMSDRVWYSCGYDTREDSESVLKFYLPVLSSRGWTVSHDNTVYCRGEYMIEIHMPPSCKNGLCSGGNQFTYLATSTLLLTADAKRKNCS